MTADQPNVLLETEQLATWLDGIVDPKTNARITQDINKMRRGLFGDWKEVDGIYEKRLDFGPGYRVYYARFERIVIVLLGGGDKSSQSADMRAARKLWKELKDEIKEI